MEHRDPQDRRRFLIPLNLVTQVREKGIPLDKLQEMVRLSARCTHADGNRRYEDFIFMVEGNRVISVAWSGEKLEADKIYKCQMCKDTDKIRVFNECPTCEGVGCTRCDGGLVPGTIPCPACSLNRMLSKHY